jgi:hypothetical protein
MVGHIHDLIAAVGAGLAARCAHAIQPSAQSAFNALMILRFMRDDAMTLRTQKDQAALRARQKSASRFCGFISVTARRQKLRIDSKRRSA